MVKYNKEEAQKLSRKVERDDPNTVITSAKIVYSSGKTVLIFPRERIYTSITYDLFFDEKTFNIQVTPTISTNVMGLKPLVSEGAQGWESQARFSLDGFLSHFNLDSFDMVGKYTALYRKDTKIITVLYHTRTAYEDQIKKGKRKRFTVVLNGENEEQAWRRLAGELPMTTFITSAVNTYIRDHHQDVYSEFYLPD